MWSNTFRKKIGNQGSNKKPAISVINCKVTKDVQLHYLILL